MKKILVIEDEGIIRLSILNLLNANGFNAVGAEDGYMGLQSARKFIPDLILCNKVIPKITGMEVLIKLRSDPITASIPFVFLTAQLPQTEVNQEPRFMADAHIIKPTTSHEILQIVFQFLKS